MKTISNALLLILIVLLFTRCNPGDSSINYKKKGYESLFNGKDLSGWQIPEGDNGHWKVLDGVIDYDALSEAEGNKSLFSEREFSDYKLHLEWRFKETFGLFNMPVMLPNGELARDSTGKVLKFKRPNADSGIYIRGGREQINLWCWGIGSGELVTRILKDLPLEERMRGVPLFHADNPVGEWNSMDIKLTGKRITIYLNDILVIDNALLPDLPDKGVIGFQHHGGLKPNGEMKSASSVMQIRNIWIKEL